MQLSKSDYLLYLKHPAWLWLKKRDRDKLPVPGDNVQAILDAGTLFESYAEQRFPDGLRLSFEDYQEYSELTQATKDVLQQNVQTIFQGRFEAGDLTCIVDVLDRTEDGAVNTYDLYEIKASSKAKPEHVLDLAFQVTVLERAGYNIRTVSVIHVNKDYVRQGPIDPQKSTAVTDITKKVRAKLATTERDIDNALQTIAQADCPDISPRYAANGGMQEWLSIFRNLRPDIPPYSIYDLCSASAKAIGQLEDEGIMCIVDIPSTFKLTAKQRQQVEATQHGRPIIDIPQIKSFLDELQYPLYFLDYETLSGTVPHFDGTQAYQQIPFQYSLHVIESPGAPVRHKEYLHRINSNPVEPLSEQLQKDISTKGSVITWYKSFEKGCNTLMGELDPKFTDFYEQINGRIVDLIDPFANGWYVDKACLGSASIKSVLPVLVPELSYKTLGIQEGQAAQRLWMEAVLDGKHADQKEQILDDLVEYCGLDTMAMVKIYEILKAL